MNAMRPRLYRLSTRWRRGTTRAARVHRRLDEAPDVKTFTFRSADAAWFRYQPGQFLTLELPVAGRAAGAPTRSRPRPSRPLSITMTVKAQAGSIGTRWMLDNLRPGMRIKAFGPAGISRSRRSGGQISVHLGRLRRHADDVDAALAERLRPGPTSASSTARGGPTRSSSAALELLGTRMPAFAQLHHRGAVEPRGLDRPMGRINAVGCRCWRPDYLEREVYCCGPEPFMQAVRDMLDAAGFDMEHYHQESFAAPAVEPMPAP